MKQHFHRVGVRIQRPTLVAFPLLMNAVFNAWVDGFQLVYINIVQTVSPFPVETLIAQVHVTVATVVERRRHIGLERRGSRDVTKLSLARVAFPEPLAFWVDDWRATGLEVVVVEIVILRHLY